MHVETFTRTTEDVLYVQGLGTNLFSIGAATNSGMIARFSNDQVSLHRGDHIVLTGKRTSNTLYLLYLKPLTTCAEAENRTDLTHQAGLRASLLVWHQRLGYMNHQTILRMISKDLTALVST